MAGFKKAVRTAAKFKGAIQGASGSGKTYTALNVMTALIALTDPGKRIAVIDTEESAALYAPPFDFDVDADFGVGTKKNYSSAALIAKLEAARVAGEYGGVVIDSATHFWKEAGGFLAKIDEVVNRMKANGKKPDSHAAWKEVDPQYRALLNYIRTYPLHVIMCVRAKTKYERVEGSNGKGGLQKVGLEPEFRDGYEYEVDAQFTIDQDHIMVPLKHRLTSYLDGKVFKNPGQDVAEVIAEWINAGAPAPAVVPPAPATTPDVSAAPAVDTTATPPTERALPAAPPAAVEDFKAKIAAAATTEELANVGQLIKASKTDMTLTEENYRELSRAYAARQTELKEAA